MSHCDSHLDLVKSVAVIETTIVALDKRINGSLLAIEKHMDQGAQWRIAIIGTATLLVIQFVILLISGAKMSKQIEINTKNGEIAEAIFNKWYGTEANIANNEKRLDHIEHLYAGVNDRLTMIEKLSYGVQEALRKRPKTSDGD